MKQEAINTIKASTDAELKEYRAQIVARAGLNTATRETAEEYIAAIDAELLRRGVNV